MNVTNYLNSMTKGQANQPIKKAMDQDAFLKLFVKQLQHQDPLNPMDSKESASQIAQFTQVEKLTQMNKTMTTALQQLVQNSVMGATSAIGKNVVAGGVAISKTGANVSKLTFNVPENAKSVRIHIYDSKKNVVRTVDLGAKAKGDHNFTWDGRDTKGKALADGTYTVGIEARDSNDKLIRSTSKVSGTVAGVTIQNGQVVLKLKDGREVLYKNVTQIENPPAQANKAA